VQLQLRKVRKYFAGRNQSATGYLFRLICIHARVLILNIIPQSLSCCSNLPPKHAIEIILHCKVSYGMFCNWGHAGIISHFAIKNRLSLYRDAGFCSWCVDVYLSDWSIGRRFVVAVYIDCFVESVQSMCNQAESTHHQYKACTYN
jgi:hypothetical protein